MGNEEGTGSYPFLKSAYYRGKLLRAADFLREQKYGNSKLEFMNRKFHGWGIIEGLEVRSGQGGNLFLSKGSAIDPQGRILAVTEDSPVRPDEIEEFHPERGHEFILGIRYAEQTLETEYDHLEKEEHTQPSVIAETYSLRAFEMEEFRKLKSGAFRREKVLTEEKVLYENGTVMLTLMIPKIVPADSLFRVSMQVKTTQESDNKIGWRGMVRLQGAVFAQSGEGCIVMEEEPAICSGSVRREWEICTEENRKLPVMLEISHLEIVMGNTDISEVPACQLYIETAVSYEQTVIKYLQEQTEWVQSENWVPLACLRPETPFGQNAEGSQYILSVIKENNVRCYVDRFCEEAALRRIEEESGILDIRWRRFLKHVWKPPMPPAPMPPMPPGPMPPVPPGPMPPRPIPPDPGFPVYPEPEDILTELRFWELMDKDRENHVRKGIIVIPVPRHYRKGQILFSDEIPHGFPGQEVFLWCGRVWEEHSYLHWERDRKQYRIIDGNEELFSDVCDGQEILKQAVLQNVEAGTFQVALTLKRGHYRKRSREVVISWTAVRST